jgi:hypothetical protein
MKELETVSLHALSVVTGGDAQPQVLGTNKLGADVAAPLSFAGKLGLHNIRPIDASVNPQVLGTNALGAKVAAPLDVAGRLKLRNLRPIR